MVISEPEIDTDFYLHIAEQNCLRLENLDILDVSQISGLMESVCWESIPAAHSRVGGESASGPSAVQTHKRCNPRPLDICRQFGSQFRLSCLSEEKITSDLSICDIMYIVKFVQNVPTLIKLHHLP